MPQRLWPAILFSLVLSDPVCGKVIFVSKEGDNSTGSSWEEAFTSPSEAILASASGDELWIKGGEYALANVKIGVRIYGGFSGIESIEDRGERDWAGNPTYIGYPAGMEINDGCILDGLIVTGGNAFYDGGGMRCSGLSKLTNCRITNNHADERGGGVFINRDAKVTMVNCVLDHNEAWHLEYPFPPIPGVDSVKKGSGGAIYIDGGSLFMTNCTVVDNFSPIDSGIDTISGFTVLEVTNSIIIDPSYLDQYVVHSDVPFFSVLTSGNINNDPLFVDRENQDYRLKPNSPCIDTGTDTGIVFDLGGHIRPVDVAGRGGEGASSYDMGCYEFQLSPADLTRNGVVNSEDLLEFQRQWMREGTE